MLRRAVLSVLLLSVICDVTTACTGVLRTQQIGPCGAAPCYNGGVCLGVAGSLNTACDCTGTNFFGDQCTEAENCAAQPCFGNSSCFMHDDDDWGCQCADPRFGGRRCGTYNHECRPAKPSDECHPLAMMCRPGTMSPWRCTCSNRTQGDGRHCREFPDCASQPCDNGGRCIPLNDRQDEKWICDCSHTDFTADRCAEPDFDGVLPHMVAFNKMTDDEFEEMFHDMTRRFGVVGSPLHHVRMAFCTMNPLTERYPLDCAGVTGSASSREIYVKAYNTPAVRFLCSLPFVFAVFDVKGGKFACEDLENTTGFSSTGNYIYF